MTSASVASWSPLPVLIYTSPVLFIATGLCGDTGISNARTVLLSMSNFIGRHETKVLNLLRERKVPTKSCSIFSALDTPAIWNTEDSWVFLSLTPNTTTPPAVLENALTVSHTDFGRPPEASLTSKSSHSMSSSLASSSSFVIAYGGYVCSMLKITNFQRDMNCISVKSRDLRMKSGSGAVWLRRRSG